MSRLTCILQDCLITVWRQFLLAECPLQSNATLPKGIGLSGGQPLLRFYNWLSGLWESIGGEAVSTHNFHTLVRNWSSTEMMLCTTHWVQWAMIRGKSIFRGLNGDGILKGCLIA